jgi:glycosyltransferase involved in cell wall biosynthesis
MSFTVSVVIPAYNSAAWLPETIKHVSTALDAAKLNKKTAEIIIVDDGSSDNTLSVARELKSDFPIEVITQKNSGRFLARKAGVEKTKHEYVWFIDSRVHPDKGSIAYVLSEIEKDVTALVWNGHVNVYKKGNIIARFMDSITLIGWRRYFGNPRRCSYGLKDFDYYPKGTGCFLVPKSVLLEAMNLFMSQTTDLRNSSDDTLLIRIIAKQHNINLSPQFSCTYFARNTLKAFMKHTYNRGKFFVDGFLRPGTRFNHMIQAFLIACIIAPLVMVLYPAAIVVFVVLFVLLWLLELIVALLMSLDFKDAGSLFLLSPVFAACYGLGIWSVVIKRKIKL